MLWKTILVIKWQERRFMMKWSCIFPVKREYLRKMTQKAKNIYTLFKGIGIDKIGVVTSSADAISRLTDAQIQNIINLYTDELTKSQKLIGVNNCSRTRDLLESKKSPDVGISTPPTSKTNQTNE